jgi:hypothetical protein
MVEPVSGLLHLVEVMAVHDRPNTVICYLTSQGPRPARRRRRQAGGDSGAGQPPAEGGSLRKAVTGGRGYGARAGKLTVGAASRVVA